MEFKIKLIFFKVSIRNPYTERGTNLVYGRGIKIYDRPKVGTERLLQQFNMKSYFRFTQSPVLGSQKTIGR
jgi:hypothetical protein